MASDNGVGLLSRFAEWLREGDSKDEQQSQIDPSFIELDELLTRYEIVDVDPRGVVYVVDHPTETRRTKVTKLADAETLKGVESGAAVSMGEISGSGETIWRRAIHSDYNPDLSGRRGIETYREMRRDAVVRAALRVAKTPILSARWFIEPASKEQPDLDKSKFIWYNLTRWMSSTWHQFLIDQLYMLDYGVIAFEKVFDFRSVDGEQRVVWKKFAPRHPLQINEFVYDDEGGPSEIMIETETGESPLPIWKALVFTHDKEVGDLWGESTLRSAYKHWFYKETLYKIDAIQKERHGIGIPVVVLPVNFSKPDKDAAERLGEDLRANEKAHVTLPPGWDVKFLKIEGQMVNALESAEHHAQKIWENVLATFMRTQQRATAETRTQETTFVRAVRFVAELQRDVINNYAIPQLCLYNWPEEEFEAGFPQMRVRRLGDERDWRVLSFAMRNLVGAGLLRPDDELEDWLREEMDMPQVDLATIREVLSPQQAKVGLPRQSTAPGNTQGKSPSQAVGPVGQDRSGTSGSA